MQFMILRRSDQQHETGVLPAVDAEAMQAYTRMLDEAGVLRAIRTLKPSTSGVRMHITAGQGKVVQDPVAQPRELHAGFAIIEVDSRQEALDWMQRWPAPDGNGQLELELRDMGCPGGCAEVTAGPTSAPGKPYIVLLRASDDLETEVPVPQHKLDTLDAHNLVESRKGVLMAADGLRSTATSTRVKRAGGKLSLVDGPFTEIKELIAGYWLIRAQSLDDAIAWARRNPYPTGPEVEVEIREVYEVQDQPVAGAAFTPELREAEQRMRAQQLESGMRAQFAAPVPAWR